jgi:hypothetical protein
MCRQGRRRCHCHWQCSRGCSGSQCCRCSHSCRKDLHTQLNHTQLSTMQRMIHHHAACSMQQRTVLIPAPAIYPCVLPLASALECCGTAVQRAVQLLLWPPYYIVLWCGSCHSARGMCKCQTTALSHSTCAVTAITPQHGVSRNTTCVAFTGMCVDTASRPARGPH